MIKVKKTKVAQIIAEGRHYKKKNFEQISEFVPSYLAMGTLKFISTSMYSFIRDAERAENSTFECGLKFPPPLI